MRPALEYASSVWSPIASSTSINNDLRHNQQLRTHYTKHRHTHQSAAHNTTAGRTTWHTIHALNSDHLPIITTITRTKYKLQQNRHTFTNYRKANWTPFTTDTEAAFSDIQPPPDIHTANTIFTNILHADKHNIPKGNIHSICILDQH